MKRLLIRLVLLLLVVVALLVPALGFDLGESADAGPEPTRITSYVADFVVADDGSMQVTETITVDFPISGRRGIFRFWDKHDPNAPSLRREPRDITVSRDGQPDDLEVTEQDHRYVVARIGSPSRTLTPGEHVYEISYTIDDALIEGDGDGSRFYWNLVPGGWRQVIDQARLSVQLPAEAGDVQCAVGSGSTVGCAAEGEGSRTLTVETGRLSPNTPVTVSTQLPVETPEVQGTSRPWSLRWDPVLGHPVALVLVLLLALAAGAWGTVLSRRARETDPGFPLVYAPPEGIGPAQGRYILTEHLDREAFVATVLHAAEQGAIDLRQEGKGWAITDTGGPEAWNRLDPVTVGIAQLLHGPGTTFVANKKSVKAGKKLAKRLEAWEKDTKQWARSSGLMVTSGLGGAGAFVVGACLVGVLAIAIFNPLAMSAVGLVPGMFAIGGISLAARGSGTRRTRTGRDLWSRVGGFHRILSTPSAEARFDFSGRKELYTAYVPWAVAFGCADAWADKYKAEVGAEPPTPGWLDGAYAGSAIGHSVNDIVDSFSSTVDSAISSYEATQSSSSSGGGGGGGFSGGGGGGGGGGGSW